jgi:hypothetical protein
VFSIKKKEAGRSFQFGDHFVFTESPDEVGDYPPLTLLYLHSLQTPRPTELSLDYTVNFWRYIHNLFLIQDDFTLAILMPFN